MWRFRCCLRWDLTFFRAPLPSPSESITHRPTTIKHRPYTVWVAEISRAKRAPLGIPTNVPFLVTVLASDQIQLAGDAAEGAITFTNWIDTASTPGNQAFVQNYQATYGIEPNTWAVLSYASVYILAEAIEAAQSTDPFAIRDALANIMDFDTVLGEFSFNAVGDAVYDPVVLIVKNGEFQVFE